MLGASQEGVGCGTAAQRQGKLERTGQGRAQEPVGFQRPKVGLSRENGRGTGRGQRERAAWDGSVRRQMATGRSFSGKRVGEAGSISSYLGKQYVTASR